MNARKHGNGRTIGAFRNPYVTPTGDGRNTTLLDSRKCRLPGETVVYTGSIVHVYIPGAVIYLTFTFSRCLAFSLDRYFTLTFYRKFTFAFSRNFAFAFYRKFAFALNGHFTLKTAVKFVALRLNVTK